MINDLITGKGITGRLCMLPREAWAVASALALAGKGDHLEIGSMWGASAILAARARPYGKIVCIDPFTSTDMGHKGQPGEDVFWDNMYRAGIEKRVELYKTYSNPFPITGRKFTSCLIDGDHLNNWPMTDWNNVKGIVKRVVVFHDTQEEDVIKAVEAAKNTPGWELFLEVERVKAFYHRGEHDNPIPELS